ncbi:MAG: ATP-dependent RecD-like DNA helicase [Deltaproteobacteria bacterium]|nr:ATP-dependent RecD-like DNA helicase [Deltaproteobacteria bacterium]MBW2137031.1 ATP-dependent RecD-like DNA helicase [Deltaproteobacteria bacterium]
MVDLQETSTQPNKGQSLIELEGLVERITYSNEETGYTVARMTVRGHRDCVTVVGNLISPAPGETLLMKGVWQEHPKFGRQFKVYDHHKRFPASIEGIKKYLGSGLIKGIGPVMASRIVNEFGKETLKVIEGRTEDLTRIQGIGRKRVDMIKNAWREQKEIREVMMFLQQHGISPGYATKIFKKYGWNSISVVTKNPYRLATEVFGIGFVTADNIAEKLGFQKDSLPRAEAGILYVLNRLTEEGHVFYPYDLLIEKCRDMLGVDKEIIQRAFSAVVLEKKVALEDLNPDLSRFEANRKAVYPGPLYTAERGIASHLGRLIQGKKNIREIDFEKAIAWVEKRIGLTLAQKQAEAVGKAVAEKVMVITGGPGTGKTTIIRAVIEIYRQLGARIRLAAPTGRASKRMSEATGYPAQTLHRLLEFSPRTWRFERNQERPLKVDVLVVDEVSMIDTVLAYHLLCSLPSGATVIFVGDENQLPSVGAGNVLKDIIDSGVVPVVELKEIFRQSVESQIVINAHRINSGRMPEVSPAGKRLEDFYFIEQEDPEQVLSIIMELVQERIPRRFRMDPINDIQILSPMHKGIVGTDNLNRRLQGVFNPSEDELVRGGRAFRSKDKVMQVRNNYEKEVFNGDIGRIAAIDMEGQELIVNFDGARVSYDFSELDELVLAYAISVHKSQGSEYPAVIIPLLQQHYMLLQRNLIYTAVTRGKRLVVIVGSKKALAMGVRNDRIMKRYTYLSERLRSTRTRGRV